MLAVAYDRVDSDRKGPGGVSQGKEDRFRFSTGLAQMFPQAQPKNYGLWCALL